MKKNFFNISILLCLLFTAIGPEVVFAQIPPGMSCPVMPGERIKQKFYVDYKGERIYLCCRNCVIAFKRNPEKYMKRMLKLAKKAGS